MPILTHLDKRILAALGPICGERGVPPSEQEAIRDLLVFAKAFVRLDAAERKPLVEEAQKRASSKLPGNPHVLFVD